MDGPEAIDKLGRWPASLDLATCRSRHGDDMPIGIPRSVTPAACDAWLTALARHGRLSLAVDGRHHLPTGFAPLYAPGQVGPD